MYQNRQLHYVTAEVWCVHLLSKISGYEVSVSLS